LKIKSDGIVSVPNYPVISLWVSETVPYLISKLTSGTVSILWVSRTAELIYEAEFRNRPNFVGPELIFYGFNSFSELLEEADEEGLLKLQYDDWSGGYFVLALKDS